MTNEIERTKKIAALNDMLRQSQLTGQIELSDGVKSLGRDMRERILSGVKNYNAFAPQNDAQAERNFGALHATDTKSSG